MTRIPTVQISTPGGPVVINATDYDPDVHELAEGSTLPDPDAPAPVEPGTDPNPLAKIADDTPAPVAQPAPAATETPTGDAGAQTPPNDRDGVSQDDPTAAAKIAELEAQASVQAEQSLAVMKVGKRFKVVDSAGQPVVSDNFQKTGYADEAAAWAAIVATKS